MKCVILCTLFALFGATVTGQRLYSITEHQMLYKGEYYLTNYTSYKLTDRFGISIDVGKYPGYLDAGAGVVFASNSDVHPKFYWEAGMGLGTTFSSTKGEKNTYYSQLYIWMENLPDQQLAEGKVCIQLNPAYAFGSDDPWWMQHYIVYSITKNIAIGAHYQAHSASGVRAEFNLRLAEGVVLRTYGVMGTSGLIGVSFIVLR